jgi:hypothetical protein
MRGPYTAADSSKLAPVRGALSLVAIAAIAAVAPGVADAGRTPYGWLFGTEVIPERGAEIQTWVAEENGTPPADRHDTTLWWGALVGVTDRLELALPVEMRWRDQDGAAPSFTVHWFGLEARYRLVSQDPVEAPALAPLVRVAVKRDVTVRDRVRVEADLVVSYTAGRVHALVDAGAVGELGRDDSHFELHPGAGVSFAITGELRLGAEVYAELSLDSERESWAVVGPNVAWTHGRFWLSAAFGIGVYQIDTAPRVVWGILF